jgi:hypothetical protein
MNIFNVHPKLGRLPAPDAHDGLYPLRAALHRVVGEPLPTHRAWYGGNILDQGQTSSCVGHGWRTFLSVAPIELGDTRDPSPFEIYHGAQRCDEWPGEDYDGTSVRGGAKFLQQLGHIAEYRWALDIDDMKLWLLTKGSIVIGINWYTGMFSPDAKHIITASGQIEGGHCVCVIGYNSTSRLFEFQQSWGKDWGNRGRAYIPEDLMKQLIFSEGGEACAALQKKVT